MRLAHLRRPVPRYSRAVQPDHLPLRRKSPDERPPERVRSGCRSRNRIRSRGQRSPHGCSRTRTARGSSNGGCLNPSYAHLSWLSTPVRGSPCENYCPHYIILFYQSEDGNWKLKGAFLSFMLQESTLCSPAGSLCRAGWCPAVSRQITQ